MTSREPISWFVWVILLPDDDGDLVDIGATGVSRALDAAETAASGELPKARDGSVAAVKRVHMGVLGPSEGMAHTVSIGTLADGVVRWSTPPLREVSAP